MIHLNNGLKENHVTMESKYTDLIRIYNVGIIYHLNLMIFENLILILHIDHLEAHRFNVCLFVCLFGFYADFNTF